jgi:hypothetical protein
VLRTLRNRDFALLVSGQAVAQVGDGIFAVSWHCFHRRRRPGARSVWQASLAVLVWNLFLWSGEILWLTLLGLTVPNHISGRVSSIDYLGSYLLIPLSMALTGPVAAVVGPRLTLVGAGVGGAVAVLLTLAVPGVRRPKYLPAASEGIPTG